MSRQVKTALSVAVVLIALIFGLAISGTLDGLLRTLDPGTGGETAVERQATAPDSTTNGAGNSAAIAERIVPVFDLVRVEPNGEAVIAGKGAPNAVVEILSGDGVVADGKATAEGDWAIVLEDPLAAGAHDIRVRATSPDGATIESEQRVAVSVPAGGQGEVLVVLNEPGAASAVLQLPGAEGADGSASVTPPPALAASGAAASATAQVEPSAGNTAAAAASDAAEAAAGEQPPPAPSAEASATAEATTTAPAASEPAASAAAPATVPAGSDTEAADTPAPPIALAEAAPSTGTTTTFAPAEPSASTADATAPAASDNSADDATSSGESTEAPEGLAGKPTAPQAGTAPGSAGATAGAPAAAPAAGAEGTASGTSADPAATAPGEGAAPVAGAAETPASATPAQPADESANEPAAAEAAPATAAPAASAPATAPVVTVEAVEVENRTTLFAAGAADNGARVRLYIDDVAVGDAVAGNGGRWLVQQTIAPLEPGAHRVRADRLGAGGDVVARAEVTFTFAAEAAVAEPQVAESAANAAEAGASAGLTVAGSGTGAAAAGGGDEGEARVGQPATIIIRTGDNLWTISRRLYGRGVRYSTIYLANTDQIRDPNRIYPGQVFVLPSGDANWPAEPAAPPAE